MNAKTLASGPASGERHRSRRGADRSAPFWRALRGTAAVLVLLLELADAWLTSQMGVRPVAPMVRHLAAVLAAEVRARMSGVIEAEVVEDCEKGVWR
ncbi:hypothetical protein [Bailinhaonella thermotolerans]|uniref:Uncharacterized protein n=1 Tax=Bailinhaonella thermotolerans TaxID=1070861 RepID=A0A3A4A566_9ACTN|nr:hypothetical protein [Bailinhaonella thermotolerans]RJL19575.1 hypothetical protein D5H75_40260 [Bailinhaonella thermotolerans]